jgi:D-tyrosyl-tRNA(Tyr) deacylase
VVSQFTLYGNCRKGRRPSFDEAALPEFAERVYDTFIDALKRQGIGVATGIFGAKMLVEIHNDGPVTFILESS